jgi:hypothetical protein
VANLDPETLDRWRALVVVDPDGSAVGTISEFYLDRGSGQPTWARTVPLSHGPIAWQHAKAGPGSGSLGGGLNLHGKRPRRSFPPPGAAAPGPG